MALIKRSTEAIQVAQLENHELRDKLDKKPPPPTKIIEVPVPAPPPPKEISYLSYNSPFSPALLVYYFSQFLALSINSRLSMR